MRKYVQKQLLKICEAMGEANELLRQLNEAGGPGDNGRAGDGDNGHTGEKEERILGLLGEEQDAAVRIGETVEQTEGEGRKLVELLENYCDLLWHYSQEQDKVGRAKLYKKLRKELSNIVNSLRYEIPRQYEIVFLPYKASMWDSLESVWLAAREEKDCHCHVIPIPYYDKNPDGSFGRLNYEGGQFPPYVPVTDYRKYSLDEIHPEAIFIHNPYDNLNYVTSVLPEFYSAHLNECTDMLAYIPYYVAVGDVTEDMCLYPGVLNADRVFVQSEKIRQEYLQVWKSNYGLGEGIFKKAGFYDKIQALGSPKIDKALNTKREDIALPPEWEEKIHGGQ